MGRWRALANAGFVLAVLALAGFGMAAGGGPPVAGAERRSGSGPTSRRSAGWRSGSGSGCRGSTPGWSRRSSRRARRASRSRLVFRVDERLRPLVRRDATARIVDRGGGRGQGRRDRSRPARRPAARRLGVDRHRAADRGGRPARARPRPRCGGSTPWRRPPSAAWARSTPSPRSIRKGEGSLGKFVQDDEAYRKLVGALGPGRADAPRPRGEPGRAEADLAVVALLQRPGRSSTATASSSTPAPTATARPSARPTSSSPAARC